MTKAEIADILGEFEIDEDYMLKTKAEIDDILGEFEIDEDYMIKTKDVIGLFVAVKEEPKVEEPAPVEEAPEAEPEEDADAKKKKKKKKPANFEDSTFQTRYRQYGGGNHPNNIVAWYLTSTNISFIMNSQFTNKYILLWEKKK